MQLRNYANYWVNLFGASHITAGHKILTEISPRVMCIETPGVNTLLMSQGQSDLPAPGDLNRSFNVAQGKTTDWVRDRRSYVAFSTSGHMLESSLG